MSHPRGEQDHRIGYLQGQPVHPLVQPRLGGHTPEAGRLSGAADEVQPVDHPADGQVVPLAALEKMNHCVTRLRERAADQQGIYHDYTRDRPSVGVYVCFQRGFLEE